MKLVCTKTNKETIVKNSRKPKMTSGYFGRSWDILYTVKINDAITKLWADTTWGLNCYFEYNNKWYSVPVWEVNDSEKYILKRSK